MKFTSSDPTAVSQSVAYIKDQQAAHSGGAKSTRYYKAKPGANYVRIMPPTEDMGGIPWIIGWDHYQLGPEENQSRPCIKTDPAQPDSVCPVCSLVADSMTSPDKAVRDQAYRMRAVLKPAVYLIDLNPVYDASGVVDVVNDEIRFPDCWGVNWSKDPGSKCQNCRWMDSCGLGICTYSIPSTAFKTIAEIYNRFVAHKQDIVDPKYGTNIIIARTGTGQFDTRYTVLPDMSFTSLPDHIIKLFEAKEESLPAWYESQRISYEEMVELMTGDATEAADQKPDCFGQFVKGGKECGTASTCRYFSGCKTENMLGRDPNPTPPVRHVAPPVRPTTPVPPVRPAPVPGPDRTPQFPAPGPARVPQVPAPTTPPCFGRYNSDSVKCSTCSDLPGCSMPIDSIKGEVPNVQEDFAARLKKIQAGSKPGPGKK